MSDRVSKEEVERDIHFLRVSDRYMEQRHRVRIATLLRRLLAERAALENISVRCRRCKGTGSQIHQSGPLLCDVCEATGKVRNVELIEREIAASRREWAREALERWDDEKDGGTLGAFLDYLRAQAKESRSHEPDRSGT